MSYERSIAGPLLINFICNLDNSMSGRDIHDVCQQAERRWASKVIHPNPSPLLVPNQDH